MGPIPNHCPDLEEGEISEGDEQPQVIGATGEQSLNTAPAPPAPAFGGDRSEVADPVEPQPRVYASAKARKVMARIQTLRRQRATRVDATSQEPHSIPDGQDDEHPAANVRQEPVPASTRQEPIVRESHRIARARLWQERMRRENRIQTTNHPRPERTTPPELGYRQAEMGLATYPPPAPLTNQRLPPAQQGTYYPPGYHPHPAPSFPALPQPIIPPLNHQPLPQVSGPQNHHPGLQPAPNYPYGYHEPVFQAENSLPAPHYPPLSYPQSLGIPEYDPRNPTLGAYLNLRDATYTPSAGTNLHNQSYPPHFRQPSTPPDPINPVAPNHVAPQYFNPEPPTQPEPQAAASRYPANEAPDAVPVAPYQPVRDPRQTPSIVYPPVASSSYHTSERGAELGVRQTTPYLQHVLNTTPMNQPDSHEDIQAATRATGIELKRILREASLQATVQSGRRSEVDAHHSVGQVAGTGSRRVTPERSCSNAHPPSASKDSGGPSRENGAAEAEDRERKAKEEDEREVTQILLELSRFGVTAHYLLEVTRISRAILEQNFGRLMLDLLPRLNARAAAQQQANRAHKPHGHGAERVETESDSQKRAADKSAKGNDRRKRDNADEVEMPQGREGNGSIDDSGSVERPISQTLPSETRRSSADIGAGPTIGPSKVIRSRCAQRGGTLEYKEGNDVGFKDKGKSKAEPPAKRRVANNKIVESQVIENLKAKGKNKQVDERDPEEPIASGEAKQIGLTVRANLSKDVLVPSNRTHSPIVIDDDSEREQSADHSPVASTSKNIIIDDKTTVLKADTTKSTLGSDTKKKTHLRRSTRTKKNS